MTDRSIGLPVLLVSVALAAFCSVSPAHVASCDAVVGQWAWFIGGDVTIKADGTFTHQSGNFGRWTCSDASKGIVTLNWAMGGFVNKMMLSKDQQTLSSLDPSQPLVTVRRGGSGALSSRAGGASSDLRVTT